MITNVKKKKKKHVILKPILLSELKKKSGVKWKHFPPRSNDATTFVQSSYTSGARGGIRQEEQQVRRNGNTTTFVLSLLLSWLLLLLLFSVTALARDKNVTRVRPPAVVYTSGSQTFTVVAPLENRFRLVKLPELWFFQSLTS